MIEMKKFSRITIGLLVVVFTISIGLYLWKGCDNRQVIHTYYGDFDTDTMAVAYTRNGHDWYKVNYSEKDSFNWDGNIVYVKGPIVDYYCPSEDIYEETFPDNLGNIISVEVDPDHKMDWLNKK